MKTFTEAQIRRVLVKAIYAKQDCSYYDCNDDCIRDDEYYGWQDAVEFIVSELGIDLHIVKLKNSEDITYAD